MIYEYKDYRSYLKGELARRMKEKPGFSLRALARYLAIQPSLLSSILSGKRNLAEARALDIGSKLGLSGKKLQFFKALVALDRAKSATAKQESIKQINELLPAGKAVAHDFSVDAFLAISDWQHLAILKSLDRPSANLSSSELGEGLGISQSLLESSLERLERLELIELNSTGRWVKIEKNYLIQSPLKNDGLKRYHTQLLAKTTEALTAFGPEERFTGTENILLPPALLPEANQIFEECFQKILSLAERHSSSEAEVFHVGIHCFPLSKFKSTALKRKSP